MVFFFQRSLSISFVMPETVGELLFQWRRGLQGLRCSLFAKTLGQGTVWGIWKERNRKVFEDKKRHICAVIESIICEVNSWMLLNPAFKDCSLSDMVRDWITCISACPPQRIPPNLDWVPPCEEKLKVNFDGTSFGNPDLAGHGCVLRDSHRSIILVKDGPLGICDANHAETIGLLEPLKKLKAGGHNGCYMQGDSMIALRWGR